MTHTMFMETRGSNETFALSGFRIIFKRSRGPYLLNVYLPTGLLTFISFIGFHIPVDIVPGRMALLVTIFLMFVNISAQERRLKPPVRPTRLFLRNTTIAKMSKMIFRQKA